MNSDKPAPEGAQIEIISVPHVVESTYHIRGHKTRRRGDPPAACFYARGPNRVLLSEALADLEQLEPKSNKENR